MGVVAAFGSYESVERGMLTEVRQMSGHVDMLTC